MSQNDVIQVKTKLSSLQFKDHLLFLHIQQERDLLPPYVTQSYYNWLENEILKVVDNIIPYKPIKLKYKHQTENFLIPSSSNVLNKNNNISMMLNKYLI